MRFGVCRLPLHIEETSVEKDIPKSRFKLLSSSYPRIIFPIGFVICESGGRFEISLKPNKHVSLILGECGVNIELTK